MLHAKRTEANRAVNSGVYLAGPVERLIWLAQSTLPLGKIYLSIEPSEMHVNCAFQPMQHEIDPRSFLPLSCLSRLRQQLPFARAGAGNQD